MTTYNLLPATSQGTAIENYNGTDLLFSGIPQKAAGYYKSSNNVQTISWHLINFVGKIVIEGTLDSDPATARYFPLIDLVDTLVPVTEDLVESNASNLVWIRATVSDYTAGQITKIAVSY